MADTIASFAPATTAPTDQVAGRSPRRMAWDRFRGDRWALAGVAVAMLYVAAAILAPLICRVLHIDPITTDREALNDYGLPIGRFGGVSTAHPLGVEPGTGRDLLARLLFGARVSLVVAFSLTILTTVVGLVLGVWAGFRRGVVDSVLSRFGDLNMTLPAIIVMVALTRPGTQRLEELGVPEGNPARVTYIVLVGAFFGWVGLFRIIRAQAMALREREFVEAARSCGANSRHLLFREMLPNLWGPVVAISSLTLAAYTGYEAGLSFLGVGIIPPTASWGAMLADSVHYYRTDPTYFVLPGVTLFFLVLAFYLVGEGVRDALDPKSDRQLLG